MNAISLTVNWDGKPIEKTLLEKINTSVKYRTPDGSWYWLNNHIGITQSDLATLPEDTPGVAVYTKDIRIAASCRIDNREEIKSTLPTEYFPKTKSDTAFILAAYQAWGEDCIHHLIGDFAFIIWDNRNKTIFAARDPSGVRSLYYFVNKEKLIIASEIIQIFQNKTIKKEIDEEQIIEYLTPIYQYSSGWDLGYFKNLQALPAGHILLAKYGKIIIKKYWYWQEKTLNYNNQQEILEEYYLTLEEAVRCRLRSKVKIGLELSGGLDSSAVAAIAGKLSMDSNRQLHTLSMIFNLVKESDERERIKKVRELYPYISHQFVADEFYTPLCFKEDWNPRSIMGIQEIMIRPLFDFYQKIETTGCQVVLSGHLGDALNYGSDAVYFDLLKRGCFTQTWKWFQTIAKFSPKQALKQLFLDGLVPMMPLGLLQARLLMREKKRSQNAINNLPDYFTSDLRAKIIEKDREIRIKRIEDNQIRCPVVRSTLERISPPFVTLTTPIPQPIERRHPYTDRRLIELVLAMPKELLWEKEKQGILNAGRFHHRQIMEKILPKEIIVNNIGVYFDPVVKHCMTPKLMGDWLSRSKNTEIFERGYVIPKNFCQEIEKTTHPFQNYIMIMLTLEGWLCSLTPGGKMNQLIP